MTPYNHKDEPDFHGDKASHIFKHLQKWLNVVTPGVQQIHDCSKCRFNTIFMLPTLLRYTSSRPVASIFA